jgi:hypothetical protein
MTKPTNNAARKQWLAGLKDGDVVAILSTAGTMSHIGPVARWPDCLRCQGLRFSLLIGKSCGNPVRSARWLVAASPDAIAAHARKLAVAVAERKLMSFQWTRADRPVTDDQILAAAAILWPDPVPK